MIVRRVNPLFPLIGLVLVVAAIFLAAYAILSPREGTGLVVKSLGGLILFVGASLGVGMLAFGLVGRLVLDGSRLERKAFGTPQVVQLDTLTQCRFERGASRNVWKLELVDARGGTIRINQYWRKVAPILAGIADAVTAKGLRVDRHTQQFLAGSRALVVGPDATTPGAHKA